MKFDNGQLKRIYFGAYSFSETEDGYLQAFQYSKPQMDYFERASEFWYDRCMASSAKTLEFVTEACRASFEYRIIWMGSPDSVEIAVDGLISRIWYVKDIEKQGRLEWVMPSGKKKVTVYLPADATMLIKNFAADADLEPAAKNEKVLWLGDSITQGFGPLRSAMSYVSVANRVLNYDIINQGIGGYVYDKYSITKMEGYAPDKIIVALGTNQYGTESMEAVEEFYEALKDVYGEKMPILCVSPLWRGDSPEGIPTLISFCEKVKAIAGSYPNVTVVDGFKLVPHLPEYFLDKLHPNCLGAEVYGRELARIIRELGW